jgi:hypothetical protein
MHITNYDPLDYFKMTNSQSYNRFGKLCFSSSNIMLNQLPMLLIMDFFVCNKLIRTSFSQLNGMDSIK